MTGFPHRHFIGWDRPLLGAVVEFFAEAWSRDVPDLSDSLVVVPTRQSGRRLREALAERGAERGRAVFPPVVVTPEAFLGLVRPAGFEVASPVQSLIAWIAVLKSADLGEYPALFPRLARPQDFGWASGIAETWQAARKTLGEGGLDFRSAAQRLGADHPEGARWAHLATLEDQYLARLEMAGLCDAQMARRQASDNPVLPPGIAQVVVAAVPDPIEIAVGAWSGLAAQGVPVHVLVAAPESMADAFDDWGRPIPEAWAARRDLPVELQRCHLRAGPDEQAAEIERLASGHVEPAATLALGIADAEVAQALEGSGAVPFPIFHPEGRPMKEHELFYVLSGLAAVLLEQSFSALGRWLRFPPVAIALRKRARLGDLPQARMLEAWDRYAAAHLPQSMADGRAFADPVVNALVAAAESLLEPFGREPLGAAVAKTLVVLYRSRTFRQTDPAGSAFQAVAREVTRLIETAGQTLAAMKVEATPAETLLLVLRELAKGRLDLDRPPAAVDLHGWLELPFESAPHLVVAGFNDGWVPDAIVGDPYLPESVRAQLGLRRTNATRLARDAFLLHQLLACRTAGGRVDLVLGKYSSVGEPLRPSRLLFMCPDDDLAQRAIRLFGDDSLPRPRPLPARHLAWRLDPPPPVTRPEPQSLWVTAFRDYLACPFRFYLKHILGMEPVDPEPRELDARAFGNLCHTALKALHEEPTIGSSCDARRIARFLHSELQRAVARDYGTRLTLPLRVQLASAERRLAAFAEWQAASVRDGWKTVLTEVSFETLLGKPWQIAGLEVRGRIDRWMFERANGGSSITKRATWRDRWGRRTGAKS